jgi:glycosyltransferase involved in cell wall biosynthesis
VTTVATRAADSTNRSQPVPQQKTFGRWRRDGSRHPISEIKEHPQPAPAARFSLICPTLGRTDDVWNLFDSLARQGYSAFDVILVDQNLDDRLVPIVEAYRTRLSIEHVRTASTGASRARNIGMSHARGEFIAFPDDDCRYPPDVLERVNSFFETHPEVAIYTGSSTSEEGEPVGRWDADAGPVTPANAWNRGIAFAMFFRSDVIEAIGSFNTEIGVGSGTSFGSGEETEFLIRGLKAGFRAFYDPSLIIIHPAKQYAPAGIARAFSYGAGMGYVLRQQRCGAAQTGRLLIRPLLGAVIFLLAGRRTRARYQLSTFHGRLWGYLRAGKPVVQPHEPARCGAQTNRDP